MPTKIPIERTTDPGPGGSPDPMDAPFPSEDELRAESRRRIGTLAFFALIGLGAWVLVAIVGRAGPDPSAKNEPSARSSASSPLRAGTYRLPGLSTTVTVTLPEGWTAGDSIWGPAGTGVAAVSTGRPGASISIALFDLGSLLPYGPSSTGALRRPASTRWFERSLGGDAEQVEARVRDRVVGRRLDWRPPPVLGWVLAHTDRGPIDVADDVAIGGRRGELVSFSFPGPTEPLLEIPDTGTIALRPGITYTFWVPRVAGRPVDPIVLGIARELGAVPGTAEWDVVRTLRFGD